MKDLLFLIGDQLVTPGGCCEAPTGFGLCQSFRNNEICPLDTRSVDHTSWV